MVENSRAPSAPEDSVPPDCDWFLCQLVRFANLGVGIGITLTVSGQTITGTLMSGAAYFKDLAVAMKPPLKAAFTVEVADQFARKLLGHAAAYEADVQGSEAGYLHLRNVKIVAPGQPYMPRDSHWWRGRISEVDGFIVGEIVPT